MEGPSNGGKLYHEVQESKLCAVHCVNTVLQGSFYSESDFADFASDLDRTERQMMLEGAAAAASNDFLSEESHNVSLDGDFSIQVLQKALGVWNLQVIRLDCPVAEPTQIDPELENAFICHRQDHWFSIRKVNGSWYNFNSSMPAPEYLSKFQLSVYLDTLKDSGGSIFLVRGNFPKECHISSSRACNSYGRWLSPEDAWRITKSRNSTPAPPCRIDLTQQISDPFLPSGDAEMLSEREFENLTAAVAASSKDKLNYQSSPGMLSDMEDEDLKAAKAASLKDQLNYPSSPGMLPDGEFENLTAAVAASSINYQSSPEMLSDMEDEDLKAAKAASLKDQLNYQSSPEMLSGMEDEDLKAAKAASLKDQLNYQSSPEMLSGMEDEDLQAAIASSSINYQSSPEMLSDMEDEDLKAAKAASLKDQLNYQSSPEMLSGMEDEDLQAAIASIYQLM